MRYTEICKPSRDYLLDLDQVSIPCAVQPSPSEDVPIEGPCVSLVATISTGHAVYSETRFHYGVERSIEITVFNCH